VKRELIMSPNFLSRLAHEIAQVVRPAQSDELEQELRRNLRLRRELGAQAANVKDEDNHLGSAVERTKAASDDLEKLRLELKIMLAMNAAGPPKGDAETPPLLLT
jgi:hypothetical protein